jgi:DHA2 family multidrug resistance protein
MSMMFITGRLVTKIQPRYLIVAGASIIALSMYNLTAVYGDTGFWYLAQSRMLLGLGLPLIFLSITAASYEGISPDKIDQASALINVARNTGGSLGVALSSNVLAHRGQFHESRLAEQVVPSNVAYQETLRQATDYFISHGSLAIDAKRQAVAWIGKQILAQSSFLAFIDVFWVLMAISLAAAALALTLRKVKLGGHAPTAH